MKKIFLLLLFFSPLLWRGAGGEALAQFTDDFTDGDFTVNPVWSGDVADWTVVSGQLRSNSSTASYKFYLSTPSTLATSAQWEFFVNLQISTSSTNYSDIFLISDVSDIKAGTPNGYFVRIGNTTDEVSLYRSDAGVITEIIDGADATTNNATLKIKVIRDATNLWTLQRDPTGTGTSYVTEGTVTDAIYTTGNFFGVAVQQSTAGFHLKHFFDNFTVSPLVVDTTPPAITSVTVISATQLDILFSENVEQVTAETEANYFVNNGIGNPSSAIRDAGNLSLVHLTFGTAFGLGITNTLTINNVQDLSTNAISGDTANFFYYVVQPGDVVINEILSDPDPPVALPNAEFVELFNRSPISLSLKNWTFNDGGTSSILPDTVLQPDSFVIICASSNTALFLPYGKVIGVSSFSLSNSGDNLTLYDDNSNTVFNVQYDISWFQDAVKDDGGWTLEMIDPNRDCFGESNWRASVDASGGTPGKVNSVLGMDWDTTAPQITGVDVVSSTQITVNFDEPVDSTVAANVANYFIDNGIGNPASAVPVSSAFTSVDLFLSGTINANIVYTLTMNNLSDCIGNIIPANTQTQFAIPGVPIQNDVVINEIYADNNPTVNLPPYEFVEIFNRSNKIFNIKNWTLNTPSAGLLPSFLLLPDSFAIITLDANVASFTQYGTVLGVSSLGLTDGGETIYLNDEAGNLIHEVGYATSWYRDGVKDDGGWTLELIAPDNFCYNESNWRASIDSNGGTPGKINSVLGMSWDTVAPQIASIEILFANVIRVNFTKTIDTNGITNLSNYFIDNGMGNPTTVLLDVNFGYVDLILPNNIDSNTVYTLTISSLKDCIGNTGTNLTDVFAIARIPFQNDVVINEIYPDNNPTVNLPAFEFLELFNRSNKILNLKNWTVNTGTAAALSSFLLLPDSFVIITASANATSFSQYGKVIGVSSFGLTDAGETLTLNDDLGNLINEVTYGTSWFRDGTKDDGGWTLELIDPDKDCFSEGNWRASLDTNGGTPGKTNSVLGMNWDTLAPQIASIEILTDSTILVNFSEAIEPAGMTNPIVYSIDNGIGNPTFVVLSPDFLSVGLLLGTKIDSNTVYTLTISSLKDCIGNTGTNLQDVFAVARIPLQNDVVINEIYPDNNPTVYLPPYEFLELYNRSAKILNLKNWTVNTGTAAVLPSFLLLPDSFVIITASANAASFAQYGKVIGVSSFGLTDAGETISLNDDLGNLINEVTYATSWFRDGTKDDGGWTLELIDPDKDCFSEGNWRASVDTNGGTPGKINSVLGMNWDVAAPQIANIEILSANSIRINFTEAVEPSGMTNPLNYSIDNGMGNPTSVILDLNYNYADLILPFNIDTVKIYTITISLLKDCIGNSANNLSAKFAIPQEADRYDVLLNEIFPDPDPAENLPAEEFVELYNHSAKTVDLKGWTFTDGSTTATLTSFLLLPDSFVIITSSANASLFSPFGKTLGASSFPGLNNTGEALTLFDNTGKMIHTVDFSDSWYRDNNKKDGGWTLELIDPNSPCEGANNWRASLDLSGGTPSRKNSVFANNPDVTSPQLIKLTVIAADTLKLVFNETINDTLAIFILNYSIDNGVGNPTSATIFQQTFNTIILTLAAPIQPKKIYTLTVNGVKDCAGNMIGLDNSAKFGLPEPAAPMDVVINEILFNPKTYGYDFVEIYNRSEKIIDLSKMILADLEDTINISSEGFLIFPFEYWVLTYDPDDVKKNYFTLNPKNFIKMSMPSFNDDEGDVLLLDANNEEIDALHYYDHWQFPLIDNIGDVGVSLERIDFDKPTQDSSNWHSAAQTVGFATPTYKNSQFHQGEFDGGELSVEPEVFSPDGDGYNDFLNIHYKVDEHGYLGNVKIYDARGRLVNNLIKNQLLALEGTFKWDGTDDKDSKARLGIYVVYVEIFKADNGKVKKYKRSCVVAGKL